MSYRARAPIAALFTTPFTGPPLLLTGVCLQMPKSHPVRYHLLAVIFRGSSLACSSCSVFGRHVEIRQRCQASSVTRHPGARHRPSTNLYGAAFRLPIGAPLAVPGSLSSPGLPRPPASFQSRPHLVCSTQPPDAPR
ncbi:hypothetical protein NDU88_001626 [Pleurodeles waltl]|uniref:Uncharacterized protein n=1 Tax=Pleurodeles waltl TaxID=8319 RepID=A0AAV7NET0_PLEWA|nr:hypothetical protein NDU88_001626 [Pleurodeles waltl]